ncbi:MAG: hypothetical protein LBH79_02175 [Nitrososphaerota archaeon]|jgi:hypothetical protein|nr:hypothetical protein [Nitrososphaerota archaeon]
MEKVEQKKRTVKQALAEGEVLVTLCFGEVLHFKIENQLNKTNAQDEWALNLDSYFVTNTLGFALKMGQLRMCVQKQCNTYEINKK